MASLHDPRMRVVHFSAALNSYTHDQGQEGTCYAHAIATLIVDALRRLGVPSLHPRDDVLQSLVRRYGRHGAHAESALAWAVRTYLTPHSSDCIHCELETSDAVKEVLDDEGKVLMTFELTSSQWTAFHRFFEAEPMGILSRNDLGAARGARRRAR